MSEEAKWARMFSKKSCEVCGEDADLLRDGRWLCDAHENDPDLSEKEPLG